MRICLLGGTGFVGSRLASALAGRGHDVVVPTRRIGRARHLLVLPTIRPCETDISDPATLTAVLRGCHSVVNLVGILNERGRDGQGFRRAHTELAENLVAACERLGVGRLVQVSALNADAKAGPSHYLRSKGAAELAICGSTATGWTILQPSVIFGPGDSFINRFAGLLRWLPGMFPLAMAHARFAPVHVDDVVAAILRVIEDPRTAGKVYQLCGPEILTLGDIVGRIAAALGLHRRVIGLPVWMSRLQARVMDFVPGKPFSTDNFLSLTIDSVCSQNGMRALGIEPRSFDASLGAALGAPLSARSAGRPRRGGAPSDG
ncbi:MAG: complex I NDUFA9 subunit family protein [Gammaproteobacteria bacterium]|nr:complex I NDUFA9 subunit family protein [Gammaproteobacteria bacterium]